MWNAYTAGGRLSAQQRPEIGKPLTVTFAVLCGAARAAGGVVNCAVPHTDTPHSLRHHSGTARALPLPLAAHERRTEPTLPLDMGAWVLVGAMDVAWKTAEKQFFFLLGEEKKGLSWRILTLNIIIIRDQPWLLPVTKFLVPLHGFSIKYSLLCKASLLSNTLLHVRHLHYQLICYFL